jgi:formylglycine-generating enzyme required for sulfatase activity
MRRLFVLTALLFAFPAYAVDIDWIVVGDPGNAADTTGFGQVNYTYSISKTEVTNTQYAEFLNAVDPTGANALGLYNPDMTSDAINGGIGFDGSDPVGSRYFPKATHTIKPVTYVSFYDALRFANWLHNGQGSGDTETGAYTITAQGIADNSITRNAGATIFLTSEDEWYKAAYYDALSTSYFDYPAGSDTQTSCGANTLLSNSANCNDAVGSVSDVGAYIASASPAGTYDQGGNVWEWNEAILGSGPDIRGLRGGSWFTVGANGLAASARIGLGTPSWELNEIGFRVAMIPEPSTALLLGLGLAALALRRRLAA